MASESNLERVVPGLEAAPHEQAVEGHDGEDADQPDADTDGATDAATPTRDASEPGRRGPGDASDTSLGCARPSAACASSARPSCAPPPSPRPK